MRTRFARLLGAAAAASLMVGLLSVGASADATTNTTPSAEKVDQAQKPDKPSQPKKPKPKPKPKWKPDPGLHYNVPRSGPQTQFRIERNVIEAINHTRGKNQAIKMVLFSFDRFPVADALIRAKQRGVSVQVIVNNHEITPAQRKLRARLGTNRWKRNFIYQCTRGCRSTGENQHSKFILFTRSGAAHDVVMFGSVNMKLNGAANQYNDLWTVNNASKLTAVFQTLYRQMRKDKPAHPMHWQKSINHGKYLLSVMPFPGANAKTDPIMKILRPIHCTGAKKPAGNGAHRTIVRVNMHAWDGKRGVYIAKRFRQLWAQGCDVKLQYGYGGKDVRQVLGTSTKRGRVPVRSNGMDTNGDGEIDLYSHMKNLIVSGNYGKDRSARFVVTGSSNYQDTGMRGDEIIVRMFGSMATHQYLNQWNWMWNKRTRPVTYRSSTGVVGRFAKAGAKATIVEPYGIDSPEWRDE